MEIVEYPESKVVVAKRKEVEPAQQDVPTIDIRKLGAIKVVTDYGVVEGYVSSTSMENGFGNAVKIDIRIRGSH